MASIYKTAMRIYEETKDLDYMEYEENYEQDIAYIVSLIESIGVRDAIAVLKNM